MITYILHGIVNGNDNSLTTLYKYIFFFTFSLLPSLPLIYIFNSFLIVSLLTGIFFLYFILHTQHSFPSLFLFPPPPSFYPLPQSASLSPFREGKVSLGNHQSIAYLVEAGPNPSPLPQG